MSRHGHEVIPDDWIAALQDALGVFGGLVLERSVVDAWTKASSLDGYTVGGIAGHVLSLAVGFQMRLDSAPLDLDTIPYQQWYGAAALSNTDDELHTQLIQLGEQFASQGPDRVRADLDKASRALVRQLRVASPDRTIPLASVPAAGVPLDDFLRTRFVEITVHAHDIASSTGLRGPSFPETAWTLSSSVVAETTGVAGTGAGYVVAMRRPEPLTRTATDADA